MHKLKVEWLLQLKKHNLKYGGQFKQESNKKVSSLKEKLYLMILCSLRIVKFNH